MGVGSDHSGWKSQRLAPGARCHGVGMLYPRLFGALYAAGGSVWRRVGPRFGDAGQIQTVTQPSKGVRWGCSGLGGSGWLGWGVAAVGLGARCPDDRHGGGGAAPTMQP